MRLPSLPERPSALAALMRAEPAEAVALAGAAAGDPAGARRWLQELRHQTLEIDGDDLLAAGVPPGRDLGVRLRRALDARLDGEAPDRARQLAVALAHGADVAT